MFVCLGFMLRLRVSYAVKVQNLCLTLFWQLNNDKNEKQVALMQCVNSQDIFITKPLYRPKVRKG